MSLDSKFSKLEEHKDSKTEVNKFNEAEHKNQTRRTITLVFLIGFFLSIGLCFWAVTNYNHHLIQLTVETKDLSCKTLKLWEIKEILSIILSALASSVGFVLGYYFKEQSS